MAPPRPVPVHARPPVAARVVLGLVAVLSVPAQMFMIRLPFFRLDSSDIALDDVLLTEYRIFIPAALCFVLGVVLLAAIRWPVFLFASAGLFALGVMQTVDWVGVYMNYLDAEGIEIGMGIGVPVGIAIYLGVAVCGAVGLGLGFRRWYVSFGVTSWLVAAGALVLTVLAALPIVTNTIESTDGESFCCAAFTEMDTWASAGATIQVIAALVTVFVLALVVPRAVATAGCLAVGVFMLTFSFELLEQFDYINSAGGYGTDTAYAGPTLWIGLGASIALIVGGFVALFLPAPRTSG